MKDDTDTWGDSSRHATTANVPDLDPLPPEGRAILSSASEVILGLGGLYDVLDEGFTAQLRAYHDAAIQAGQAETTGNADAAAALAERMLTLTTARSLRMRLSGLARPSSHPDLTRR